MTRFIQLHMLTAYPPSNPNRDDTGRPKTAIVGGTPRMRLSSQSLKRAWRTSDVFAAALDGHLAERTKRIGGEIIDYLEQQNVVELDRAREIATQVAGRFGKLETRERQVRRAELTTLAFVSAAEKAAAFALAERLAAGEKVDLDNESPLTLGHGAADIAMFGRMLADAPQFNGEAAVQVAHAFTTHRVLIEDDYFTGVDDLKDVRDVDDDEEERGAAHIGVIEYGSGVFYLYLCVDRELLLENLGDAGSLAPTALAALAEAAATVSPTGKRTTFAHNARAMYILAECGDQQPRSLAGAYFKPVDDADLIGKSIEELEGMMARMDAAYGPCADDRRRMNLASGEGTLRDVLEFVAG